MSWRHPCLQRSQRATAQRADPKALTLKCARFPPLLTSLSLRQLPCHSGDLVFKCHWAPPTLGQGGAEQVSSGAPERQKDPGGQLASAWPPLPVVPRVPSPARWKSQQLAPPPRGLSGACSMRPMQPRRGDSSWAPPAEEGGARPPGKSSWPLGTFLQRSGLCTVSQQGSGAALLPPVCGDTPQPVGPLATGPPETRSVLSQRGASLRRWERGEPGQVLRCTQEGEVACAH